MTIERKPISEFHRLTLSPRWPTQAEIETGILHPGDLAFVDLEKGEVAAFVSTDDLFEADGNRFWQDA